MPTHKEHFNLPPFQQHPHSWSWVASVKAALMGTEAYLSIMASLELSVFLSDGMPEMKQYLPTPSARES